MTAVKAFPRFYDAVELAGLKTDYFKNILKEIEAMDPSMQPQLLNRDGHVVVPAFIAMVAETMRLLNSTNPIAVMAVIDVARTGDSHLFGMSKDALLQRRLVEVRDDKPHMEPDLEAAVRFVADNGLLAD